MRTHRIVRALKMIGCGAVLLQLGGCALTTLEVVQTILLGITAGGAIAIIQNI